ncbi:cyanophycinase [Thalassotalea sediminis]|uniref:cyanophycinase n=1 Tax=Thalassotalea sediminis TaxID=1759089 RepID=UPI002573C86A|nr:cyanophycinase [Thalassotalea sediminis]
MSKTQCQRDDLFADDVKTQSLFQLNEDNIALLFRHWPRDHLVEQRAALKRLLLKMARLNSEVLTKATLRKLWLQQGGRTLVNQLADREFYLMLDALEIMQVNKNGYRVTEKVGLKHNKNPFSREVFTTFSQLAALKNAQDKPPHILVVTASARDPYEAADFYVEVFKATGAEVTWLPIDAALNTLWQEQGHSAQACAMIEKYQARVLKTIKRKFVYPDRFLSQQTFCQQPELFLNLIKKADGLFINGGDQSLTAKAFKNKDNYDNKLLTLIRQRMEKNTLLVGGTSAGTAVMSGGKFNQNQTPMITNGRSEVALVRGAKADILPNAGCQKANKCAVDLLNGDLTYNTQGGLGLFPWGIMDTHFSERGRQGRLLKVVEQTDVSFAFGVDEATALAVSWQSNENIEMKVVGQGGVFIVEKPSLTKPSKLITHYPTREDSLVLSKNKLSILFANWKVPSNNTNALLSEKDDIFSGQRYLRAMNNLCLSSEHEQIYTSHWQGNELRILINKTRAWESVTGIFKNNTIERSYCSYKNAQVSVEIVHD